MTHTEPPLVTMAAKIPAELRDMFADLAKRRNMSPSALLRRLVEQELSGAPDDVTGAVESAVNAELTERGADTTSARAAAALNLARRMDRHPTSGAANAQQLRHLLAELTPTTDDEFDTVHLLRLSVVLRRRGWQLADEAGRRFDVLELDAAERAQLAAEVEG